MSAPTKADSTVSLEEDVLQDLNIVTADTESTISTELASAVSVVVASSETVPPPPPPPSTPTKSRSPTSFERSLMADPPLPPSPLATTATSCPMIALPAPIKKLTGPTFAEIATRPNRIARMIQSKITVEVTGQEYYLVKDAQGKSFFLEKDVIEGKYPHLLRTYRAMIRGKRF